MQRPCPKCFDLDDEAVARSVRDYVNGLDDDVRADAEEYRRRLDICGVCEYHAGGLCRKCGCFTEARAAKRNSRCPEVERRW